VPVAPYGLVAGPGGVLRGVRLLAGPAAAAVVDDMGAEALVTGRPAEPAAQGAEGGRRHHGGRPAAGDLVAGREQEHHTAHRGRFGTEGLPEPGPANRRRLLCHGATF